MRALSKSAVLIGVALILSSTTARAQEPAFWMNQWTARYVEGLDDFHYVYPCQPMQNQAPPVQPVAEQKAQALCWPVRALVLSLTNGKLVRNGPPQPIMATLFVSADLVKFMPADPAQSSYKKDFKPGEALYRHQPGSSFAILGANDFALQLVFLNACSKCANAGSDPGTKDQAQLDMEFDRLGDSLKDFGLEYGLIHEYASRMRVGIDPDNQPTLSDTLDAMPLYADLNRRIAALSPAESRACILSYATYQECKSKDRSGNCGQIPACSTFFSIAFDQFKSLKATFCIARDSAALAPDWSGVARKMDAAIAARPPVSAPSTVVKSAPGAALDAMGKPIDKEHPCSVESIYATWVMQEMIAAAQVRMRAQGSQQFGSSSSTQPHGMGGAPPDPNGVMGGILGGAGTPVPRAVPFAAKVSVAAAVISANKISGTSAVYPAVAKAARIQGTVVLQATITKLVNIADLRVLSGPPLLQKAALDAVQTWQYRPYILNGAPVEVETLVNVIFTLGGPCNAAAYALIRVGRSSHQITPSPLLCHVDNRFDPNHRYHGAYPGHNEHFDAKYHAQHSHEFAGNEMRDRRGVSAAESTTALRHGK